jgi:hypothetical protein
VGKPPKIKIAERFVDWNGQEVHLDRDTIHDHIALFHVEQLLLIQQLKPMFSNPVEVRENRAAKSVVAVYDIPSGTDAFLAVSIKKRFMWKTRLISSIYPCSPPRMPTGKVIWKRP